MQGIFQFDTLPFEKQYSSKSMGFGVCQAWIPPQPFHSKGEWHGEAQSLDLHESLWKGETQMPLQSHCRVTTACAGHTCPRSSTPVSPFSLLLFVGFPSCYPQEVLSLGGLDCRPFKVGGPWEGLSSRWEFGLITLKVPLCFNATWFCALITSTCSRW